MNTNINKRLAVVGIVGLFVIIAGLLGTNHAPAASSGPPIQPVQVMNTTANPVPVVQQGTPNVNVANSAASPVLVRSVDSGALQPVNAQVTLVFPPQLPIALDTIYTVPAGKTLVVEYVSGEFAVQSGNFLLQARLQEQGTSNEIHLIPALLGSGPTGIGDSFFAISQPVKFYVKAGGVVQAGLIHAGPYLAAFAGAEAGKFYLTGHLVNAP